MSDPLARLLDLLAHQDAVLVTVTAARGSVPRDAGTWMAVLASSPATAGAEVLVGTIGGGRLEFDATAHAAALLAGQSVPLQVRYALGPSLGQCCGGVVELDFARLSASDRAALAQRLAPRQTPVALFGGGHVGHALVAVLSTLPMDITWIDSRDAVFAPDLANHVTCEVSEPVQDAVAGLAPGSRVAIMSFSHAEDLAIVAACLRRQRVAADLPYIGLIGSQTKWARFQARLRAQGFADAELAQVHCPIGIAGIANKTPPAIAISVAAQLLQVV